MNLHTFLNYFIAKVCYLFWAKGLEFVMTLSFSNGYKILSLNNVDKYSFLN